LLSAVSVNKSLTLENSNNNNNGRNTNLNNSRNNNSSSVVSSIITPRNTEIDLFCLSYLHSIALADKQFSDMKVGIENIKANVRHRMELHREKVALQLLLGNINNTGNKISNDIDNSDGITETNNNLPNIINLFNNNNNANPIDITGNDNASTLKSPLNNKSLNKGNFKKG